MIADHYHDKFVIPWQIPGPSPDPNQLVFDVVSRFEFEQLKREVENMKELLLKAKKYDEKSGQPDCENKQTLEMLRKIAKAVGVDIDA